MIFNPQRQCIHTILFKGAHLQQKAHTTISGEKEGEKYDIAVAWCVFYPVYHDLIYGKEVLYDTHIRCCTHVLIYDRHQRVLRVSGSVPTT